MQGADVALAPGATTWLAVAVAWALDEDAAPVVDALRAWAGTRTPEALVAASATRGPRGIRHRPPGSPTTSARSGSSRTHSPHGPGA